MVMAGGGIRRLVGPGGLQGARLHPRSGRRPGTPPRSDLIEFRETLYTINIRILFENPPCDPRAANPEKAAAL